MCSGIDPAANALILRDLIDEAAGEGAEILFTPEMTGMVDRNRSRASAQVQTEFADIVLREAQAGAAKYGLWVNIGSLALRVVQKTKGREKWVNRQFLIDPNGKIVSRYDKIHLFDVDLDTGESWRESSAYLGGKRAVVAPIDGAILGLSICYDVRFPNLYGVLSKAGANLITIPAAFTVPTGQAHWEVLLKARAIESAAFVVAAAQSGNHEDGRVTYGHAMVVDPWGEVLLDMGTELGIGICEIDFARVEEVRSRIPVLANRRPFELPDHPATTKASK